MSMSEREKMLRAEAAVQPSPYRPTYPTPQYIEAFTQGIVQDSDGRRYDLQQERMALVEGWDNLYNERVQKLVTLEDLYRQRYQQKQETLSLLGREQTRIKWTSTPGINADEARMLMGRINRDVSPGPLVIEEEPG